MFEGWLLGIGGGSIFEGGRKRLGLVRTQVRYLHSSMNLNKLPLNCPRAFQTGCALPLPLPHKKHQVNLLAEPSLPLPTPTTQPPSNNKHSAVTTQLLWISFLDDIMDS